MLNAVSRILCRAPVRIEGTISYTSMLYSINLVPGKPSVIIPALKYIACSDRSLEYDCLTLNIVRSGSGADTIIQILIRNLILLRNPYSVQCHRAAGAVEAIASVLAVKNDIVPPTINHEEDDKDEEIDYNLNFTFNTAQKRTVRAALSNTFGFGGHNACVIFKKYAE